MVDISASKASEAINQNFKERDAQVKAKALGIPYIDVAKLPINPDVFDYLPYEEAIKLKIIPFRQLGDDLSVAISDPTLPEVKNTLEAIAKAKFLKVNPYLATIESIQSALARFNELATEAKTEHKLEAATTESFVSYQDAVDSLHSLGENVHKLGDSMQALELIEGGAVAVHASDIHFEPREQEAFVKFRIDGVLHYVTALKPKIYDFFLTQVKHKAGMKINVTNLPQDGRYSLKANAANIDIRVSSLPSEFGESLVLRILQNDAKPKSLESLGYINPTLGLLKESTELSQGMILITGPTGSGKSTTLYTLLQKFNTGERKIITLEDPVEYKIPGIVQSSIDEESGYTFAKGLEAILRQDPDIIMVGEIRDKFTAETASQASITGHVVLCTLHTNSSLEAIPRLLNMGVPHYILASALKVVAGQRLVRTLCKCAQPANLDVNDQDWLKTQLIKHLPEQKEIPASMLAPVGCEVCAQTGYLGRIVIAEAFKVDQRFSDLMIEGASIRELREDLNSRGLLYSMQRDALIKLLNGKTTISEIKRSISF